VEPYSVAFGSNFGEVGISRLVTSQMKMLRTVNMLNIKNMKIIFIIVVDYAKLF